MSKIKKKALILGVTGQDGSLMARLLIKKKYIVHGLIRKSATGNLKNISDLVRDKKSFIVEHGDLLDVISMTNIISKIKPDEIYNFADQDHVRWSFELPSYSFAVTGSAVLNLLEIIKSIQISLNTFNHYHQICLHKVKTLNKMKMNHLRL